MLQPCRDGLLEYRIRVGQKSLRLPIIPVLSFLLFKYVKFLHFQMIIAIIIINQKFRASFSKIFSVKLEEHISK